jgi:SET family sugar efflux transporter-like MFS transporter
VAAWFWALQFAVLNPLLAVLLVSLYGATIAQAGLALGVYNVGGFVASFVIPAVADRRRDYLGPLLLAAVCGLAMVTVLAITSSLLLATIALVLLGGPPGVGSTLLFAQLRHEGAPPARVVRTRAIVSFAWVVGPPLATAVIGFAGDRAALVLLALVGVVNVATSILLLRLRARSPVASGSPRPSLLAQLRGWSRWGIVLAFLALQTTNIATVTTTALFVIHRLHAPVIWAGIALGAAALLEIPALMLAGRFTDRSRVLLVIGCGAGIAYYALAALASAPWQFVLLQPLNAWFFAVVAGLGLTIFQEVFPSPGLASGLFTNTRRVGAVFSGLLISAAAAFASPYQAVYAAAALVVALVLIGFVIAAAGRRNAVPVGVD